MWDATYGPGHWDEHVWSSNVCLVLRDVCRTNRNYATDRELFQIFEQSCILIIIFDYKDLFFFLIFLISLIFSIFKCIVDNFDDKLEIVSLKFVNMKQVVIQNNNYTELFCTIQLLQLLM